MFRMNFKNKKQYIHGDVGKGVVLAPFLPVCWVDSLVCIPVP